MTRKKRRKVKIYSEIVAISSTISMTCILEKVKISRELKDLEGKVSRIQKY